MIVARAEKLRQRLAELRTAQLSDKMAADVAERAQLLAEHRDAFRRIRLFLDAADAAGLMLGAHGDHTIAVQLAAERLREFARSVAGSPEGWMQGSEFAQAVRAIQHATSSVEQSALNAWREYTRPEDWDSRAEIARVLRQAVHAGTPRHQILGQLLNACHDLKTLANKTAPDAADIARFETARATFERLWPQISGGEELDPDVLDFIRAAGTDGAPLEDYTEHIAAGLERLRLTPNFSVFLLR